MKKNFLALMMVLVLLSACAPSVSSTVEPTAAPTAEPTPVPTVSRSITVVDALGRTVVLPEPPQRIVITGKALFMIADAVYMFPEAADRIAGLGNTSQGTGNFISMIDPEYEAKASLLQDAGAEQVASLHPDLIILKSYLAETVGKPFEELNIPVVYVDFETPQQYDRDVAILGTVFQDESRAQQIAEYYQGKVSAIQTALENVADKPSVLMLYYSDKDGVVAFNVPPMTWIQTQMVELAGGEPVWASANPGKGWTTVTLEQIAAWDADQIFIISYFKNPSEVVTDLKTDPQWQALRAVKQGHLYAFPGDLYSWDEPDVRWILGLSWLAARLHPDLFPQIDIIQEAQKFYLTMYDLDAQFFEEKIQPTFFGDLP